MTDNSLTIKETYHPNGKIKSRDCKNAQGQRHNPAGPAYQYWYSDGQPAYQAFYINGVLHNPAGLLLNFGTAMASCNVKNSGSMVNI